MICFKAQRQRQRGRKTLRGSWNRCKRHFAQNCSLAHVWRFTGDPYLISINTTWFVVLVYITIEMLVSTIVRSCWETMKPRVQFLSILIVIVLVFLLQQYYFKRYLDGLVSQRVNFDNKAPHESLDRSSQQQVRAAEKAIPCEPCVCPTLIPYPESSNCTRIEEPATPNALLDPHRILTEQEADDLFLCDECKFSYELLQAHLTFAWITCSWFEST